jgi:transglutaminase-like putative cysteine protease
MSRIWFRWFAVLLSVGTLPPALAVAEPSVRHVQIRYAATVTNIPADAHRIRMWLPYPQSGDGQTISNITIEAPYAYKIEREPEYGNTILSLEGAPTAEHALQMTMTFDAVRDEQVNRPGGRQVAPPEDARVIKRFRQADRLVPLDGKIAEVAREATRTATAEAERARAIYDYVTTHLQYDKSGTGWGRGDAVWACDAKRGNCTDFHSLLIGMARSVGIPAKFEIGLPLPEGKSAGQIPGYHCWAALYLDGMGWVPMDSSEASKFAAKRDYFFGAVDANRVRLSTGRDIVLEPHQDGPPLNYFVYPYVEVDGKPFGSVTQDFSFRDL